MSILFKVVLLLIIHYIDADVLKVGLVNWIWHVHCHILWLNGWINKWNEMIWVVRFSQLCTWGFQSTGMWQSVIE
jgi:hypothetical protein